MASWIVHLRIADILADRLDVDYEKFIVGNIAPDSGIISEKGEYIPPSSITHWTPTERNSDIRPHEFYKVFVQNSPADKYSFYLGYLSHLITDLFWMGKIVTKTKKTLGECYESPDIKQKVKSDWYSLDMLYLKSNHEMPSFKALNEIDNFDNVYFDYFQKDAITRKIKQICNFYNNSVVVPNREFKYLTMDEVDVFVSEAVDIILLAIAKM